MLNDSSRNIVVTKLLAMTLARTGSALIIVSAFLFIPAGTINYWNAWLFMASLFVPVLFVTAYLIKKDPELLAKRMNAKEKEKEQKLIIKLSVIPFVFAFLIPGFDYRYQWSAVPLWLVIISVFVMLTGYGMFFVVMKQNSYASRIIEIQENQKVIDFGLYSFVRHPMYLSNILMYVSVPFVLGSFYAIIPMLMFTFVFYFRIQNEEKILKEGLEGYSDYMKRVKYRLIPFVW